MDEATYDIFLSYHWQYRNEIINLHRILTKQGYKVWLDLVEIKFGDHLEARTHDAIRNTKLFICFLSEDYLRSRNCESEFYCACNENKKVYIILMEPMHKLNANLHENSFFMEKKNLLAQLDGKELLQRFGSGSNLAAMPAAAQTSTSTATPAVQISTHASDTRLIPSVSGTKKLLETVANKVVQFLTLNFSTQNVANGDNQKPNRYNSFPSVQAYRA